MKIGIVLVTYNRPEYLTRCLDSISQIKFTQDTQFIIEDAGSDPSVISMLHFFDMNTTGQRRTISQCLLSGFEELINRGCDVLINLDSDAIVRPEWLDEIIALHQKFPDQIVTGFNTLTKNRDGSIRRKILLEGEGWNKKDVSGGINYCFGLDVYNRIIKPSLERTLNGGNWDNTSCEAIGGIYCAVPSLVEHIGVESSLGHQNPDIAHDFTRRIDQDGNGHTALMLQYFGIGDIIFCAHIGTMLKEKGYKVLWPVMPEFVEACQKAYPEFTFIDVNHFQKPPFDIKEDKTVNGTRYIPIRWTYDIMKVPYRLCMRSKYDYMGLKWTDWTKTPFVRNKGREQALFDKLGLSESEPYCLVNRFFKTAMSRKANFAIPRGIKIVEMGKVGDFSLFDWAKVIENAMEIHTVSTSIIYLFEQLELKCKPYIYIRKPDEVNHDNYSYILQKHEYHLMP